MSYWTIFTYGTYTPFCLLRHWTLQTPPPPRRSYVMRIAISETLNHFYDIGIPVGKEKGRLRTVVLGICVFF